ncbi:MAG: hypothetical protein AYK22_09080 [Thermoplasmatales archaeon SG8-52-3]|nr:MAG: hypothetical protein AYK22_09080 [Thermoplasmatales archaeon SG8-52-3]
MPYILTDNEIEDILNNSVWIDTKIADIYADYLMDAFKTIDIKITASNLNKGRKGEVLLGCIIDITLYRFNFGLRRDYLVQTGFGANLTTKQGGIDYRLDLQGKIFLLEAKNLGTTNIDNFYYDDNIKDRFKHQGLNFLFITENKIKSVLKYSLPDKLDIYFIPLPYFMDINNNKRQEIKDNLFRGVEIFTKHLNDILQKKHHNNNFTIQDCVTLGMPTWFIKEYCGKSDKTIGRVVKKFGFNRKNKQWISDTYYRKVV